MDELQSDKERDAAAVKELLRKRRDLQKLLVAPAPDARWAFVILKRGSLVPKVKLAIADRVFQVAAGGMPLLVVLLLVYEANYCHAKSAIIKHPGLGWVALALAAAMILITTIDLATYQPRLFALCSTAPSQVFPELAKQTGELNGLVKELELTRPDQWTDVQEWSEKLIKKLDKTVQLDRIRLSITARVLRRVVAIVAGLAMLAYGLTAISGGALMASAPTDAGMSEHLYFALVAFFTAGFGDVFPAHHVQGYIYCGVVLTLTVIVVYFVFTEVLSSQAEFRTNLALAAEGCVLSFSNIPPFPRRSWPGPSAPVPKPPSPPAASAAT